MLAIRQKCRGSSIWNRLVARVNPRGNKDQSLNYYFNNASSRLFTISQFTIFQKASTYRGRSFW
jgi:hypothetical protein